MFLSLVFSAAIVWAKGEPTSKEEPYQVDSLPASFSHQDEKEAERLQDKKDLEKQQKLRAAALKKANEFFGDPPPTTRGPDGENVDENSPGASD